MLYGDKELESTLMKLNIDLARLLAQTALWASPDVFRLLMEENHDGTWYPNTRRYRQNRGEISGQTVGNVYLDTNNYPNTAIKRAIGLDRDVQNYHACHVWPESCYDERYHTCIANLVLLPRAIAGLSDHDTLIQQSLRYHSYELYKWHPQGEATPKMPNGYPKEWRSPFVFSDRVQKYLNRRKRI
jgi:hypothetical protein